MTIDEWTPLSQALAAAFPHDFKPGVADGRFKVFFVALADLDGDDVKRAVFQLIQTQRAFPSVADIRELAEQRGQPPADAWAEVCEWASLRAIGPTYRGGEVIPVVAPADPYAVVAAEAIGLDAIRSRTTDSSGTLRAHFFKAYEDAKKRSARDQSAALIAGPQRPTPAQLTQAATERIGRPIPQEKRA